MVQPDVPPPDSDDTSNVVDPAVFAQRRMGEGPEGLLARASAAERAVVSLEGRLQEIERELTATATQRDQLATDLQQREVTLRETAQRERETQAAQSDPAGTVRDQLQSEIKNLSERLVRADDRVAELQTDLARARGDVVEADKELAAERARIEVARRDDSDRDARLRRAEVEIEGRLAALRTAELEVEGVRGALEARRSGLESRLREVDTALVEIAARLREEQNARQDAEQALVSERGARERQIAVLRDELAVRSARVEDVQAQLGVLRGELVRVLEAGVVADDGGVAKQRLKEIETGLRELGQRALTLERERDESTAALTQAKEQIVVRDDELARLRGEVGAATEQIAALRSEIVETRSALEAAREATAAAQAAAHEQGLARERVEAELAQERATFAQQLEVADSQLRAEIEVQRRAFDEHAMAVERSIDTLHQQLAAARASMEQQVAEEVARRESAERHARDAHLAIGQQAPVAPEELQSGLEAAAARLRELAAAEGVQAEIADEAEVPLAGSTELSQAAGELAKVIEATGAEADQREVIELPARPLPAASTADWMAPALAKLNATDPEAVGRVVVDLLPLLAPDLGRDALIDFAVDELGAYRLTLHMGSGSITPWRAGASRKADLAVAGSALALSPFAVGGTTRRKPAGVEYTGRRRTMKALLKARRDPVTLGDLQAARVVPSLGGMLQLLAAAIEPAWVDGRQVVVGFESTGPGAGSWILKSGEEGVVDVAPGRGNTDAHVTVPSQGIVALLIGGEPPVAGRPTYTGDLQAALLVLDWIDRAQRA